MQSEPAPPPVRGCSRAAKDSQNPAEGERGTGQPRTNAKPSNEQRQRLSPRPQWPVRQGCGEPAPRPPEDRARLCQGKRVPLCHTRGPVGFSEASTDQPGTREDMSVQTRHCPPRSEERSVPVRVSSGLLGAGSRARPRCPRLQGPRSSRFQPAPSASPRMSPQMNGLFQNVGERGQTASRVPEQLGSDPCS
ncbi:hypothetical protein PAL_GLEAN10002301 [Pteropus alecto]|uniref:Uncharacterized protein n=1 Tax=Pteropus alecto TaxID=9402 RepID=L5KQN7_PTEAL|nr:hypothetical protein PAL_GLEAN10002301 [Pteropus alecto]